VGVWRFAADAVAVQEETTGGVSDAVTRPLQKAQGAGHPLFIWEKFFEIYFSATGRGTWRFD
jgi:hypothetical protein